MMYGFTSLLGLLWAYPLFRAIQSTVGDSLLPQQLLEGYSHTVITEFLSAHGALLLAPLAQLGLLTGVFMASSLFFEGGVLNAWKEPQARWGAFWQGGARYFWKLWLLAMISVLVHGLVMVLCYGPFVAQFMGGLDQVRDELAFFHRLFIGAGIHVCFILQWDLLKTLVKVHVVEGFSLGRALVGSLWRLRRQFFRMQGVYAGCVLVLALLLGTYLLLRQGLGRPATASIIGLVVLQQAFVFLRIGFQVFKLGSLRAVVLDWPSKN